MENINAKQLSFIFGEKTLSLSRARVMIFKANGIDLQDPKIAKKHKDEKNPECSIEKFDKVHNFKVRDCLDSMQKNFLHDKACVDYVFADIEKKIQQNKETLAFRRFVGLPTVLKSLLPEETQEELKKLCRQQFAPYLTKKDFTIQIV